MSGTRRKGRKATTPAQAGQTSAKDIVPTSVVLVPSPAGVRSGTPIEVDGVTALMNTDDVFPLAIERHKFRLVAEGAVWVASQQIGGGGTPDQPIRVSLARSMEGVQALTVLRPAGDGAGSVIAELGKPANVRGAV